MLKPCVPVRVHRIPESTQVLNRERQVAQTFAEENLKADSLELGNDFTEVHCVTVVTGHSAAMVSTLPSKIQIEEATSKETATNICVVMRKNIEMTETNRSHEVSDRWDQLHFLGVPRKSVLDVACFAVNETLAGKNTSGKRKRVA